MWIIPNLGGQRGCPAVNIAAAWKIDILRANQGQDPARLAVYACFGPSIEECIPLIEFMGTDIDQGTGRERAQVTVQKILEALRQGILVLDLNI